MKAPIPAPGPHGGDGPALASALGVSVEEILDLSASLNPVAPDPVPVVARHLGSVRRYPDASAAQAFLASTMDVDPELLVLTAGGAEAIALLAAEKPEGWVDEPEFSLYRRHLTRVTPGAARWRSNPHNPTGVLAGPAEEASVWDEAFWPMASGTWTRGDHLRGSFVLGSLTKLLACPGLRLGYLLCPDGRAARRLADRQPRWSVSGPAAEALPELLSGVDIATIPGRIALLRDELTELLRSVGFTVRAGAANWVLCEAPGLRERLAVKGICVRDCTTFGMPGTVRIAVPAPAGMARFRQALREVL